MAAKKPTEYDIVIASDLRYPGGNSSSIVEEIKAQHLAGYKTALVHMPAAHMKRRRAFNHKIIHCISTGMATFESGERPIRAKVLVIRQPRIFAEPPTVRPNIEADAKVLVINHPPFDGRFPLDNPYYRPSEVRENVESVFGEMVWAPIGPQVRGAIVETGDDVPLLPGDWHNIINVEEWQSDRSRFVADVPVIGRHSRNHVTKWLTDPEQLLSAYPDDERIGVKILGGADYAAEAIGRVPENWTVFPFGSLHPAVFLRQIDFFVYFHNPDWLEAFGRNTIEALASGVPAILPPHFEPLFQDAALYGEPEDVSDIVRGLYEERSAYLERVESGTEFVAENFGAAVHRRRLQELVGGELGGQPRQPPPPRRQRALLVAMDTDQAGSVARLLRLAERLPPHVEPLFVVTAPGVDVLKDAGYLGEHVQVSRGIARGSRRWLSRRIEEIVRREHPDVVLFDGRSLLRGVEETAQRMEVPAVWLTPRRKLPQRERCDRFRAVIRVADLADEGDHRHDAVNVIGVGPFISTGATAKINAPREKGKRVLVSLGRNGDAQTAAVVDAIRNAGLDPAIADFGMGDAGGLGGLAPAVKLDLRNPDLSQFDGAVLSYEHTLAHDLLRAGIPFGLTTGTQASQQVGQRALSQFISSGYAEQIDLADPHALAADIRTLGARMARGDAPQVNGTGDGAATVSHLLTLLIHHPDSSSSELIKDFGAAEDVISTAGRETAAR